MPNQAKGKSGIRPFARSLQTDSAVRYLGWSPVEYLSVRISRSIAELVSKGFVSNEDSR